MPHVGERLLKWLGAAMLILTVMSAGFGTWWYLQKDELRNQQWYSEDQRWNTQILADLARLSDEQSTQRVLIDELQRIVGQQFLQLENSMEELEEDHQGIVTAIYEGLADLNFRIGQHQGEHEAGRDP